MPVESDADRLSMLSDFGVTVTWSGTSFVGIYDSEYHDADMIGGVPFASSQPRLKCRTADVTGVSRGTALSVDGVSVKVRNIQPDGTGMTELVLEVQ